MKARLLLAVACTALCNLAVAQNRHFTDWPAGTDPREVGKRVAEAFIPVPNMEMPSHGPGALHYSHVATWTGSLQFAQLTHDKDLTRRLIDRFDPFLVAMKDSVPYTDHVDGAVFGSLPLELYLQEPRFRYRILGLTFADAQWDRPLPDGTLEIEQLITNNTSPEEVLNLECSLFVPGQKRQIKSVTKLGRGLSRKLYHVPGAEELHGRELWIRAEQLDGRRVLNKRWTVGRAWSP